MAETAFPAATFVSDRTCARCHAPEAAEWAGSHHAKAMQAASERTVLGDFHDVTLRSRRTSWRFFRGRGRFYVAVADNGAPPRVYEIKYTFGVFPLQQYLVAFPGGRIQVLTVAWDARPRARGGQRWYDLYPSRDLVPGDPLHWTGRYQNWNMMCAECHVTSFHKGYDSLKDRYASSWREMDVGCQACHGAGSRHLAWAGANPRSAAPDRGLIVDLRTQDSREAVDSCAACHSRRSDLVDPARIGAPLLDNYLPATLGPDLYHPDGQQRGEVYAYGSFRQSRMYAMGVRCTDCHRPHGLGLRAPGNEVCLQCHQPLGNPRFPTLQKKEYDSAEHHHHETAILCIACHMPSTTYMGVHERPDHAIRVPRPDLDTPNACNKCHADRTAAWSADWMDRWYGKGWRGLSQYATAIAAGRRGAPGAGGALAALAGDSTWPAIVRATALDLLATWPEGAQAAMAGLRDADPVVRLAAVSCAGGRPPLERPKLLAPLLDDRIRAVRAEAARQLAPVPADMLDERTRKRRDVVLGEYVSEQAAMADMPSSHLNLGALYADLGEAERAESEYRTALRLDPFFLPASFNLASLYNATGRNREAEQVLREALQRAPREGELHYSLGLLLAEEGRLQDASDALGRAASLLPGNSRVHYNHGLALTQLGRLAQAEEALREAVRLAPSDPQILYALASVYAAEEKWDAARSCAERLAALRPADRKAAELLERIRRARRP
jgi:predicted CXXCH cytochrome family protein